jgi:hypothetical protein
MSADRISLGAEQRGALTMLADAGPRGFTETVMLVNGFTKLLLTGLVHDGLATTELETVMVARGGLKIQVARVRITEAGRRALENR